MVTIKVQGKDCTSKTQQNEFKFVNTTKHTINIKQETYSKIMNHFQNTCVLLQVRVVQTCCESEVWLPTVRQPSSPCHWLHPTLQHNVQTRWQLHYGLKKPVES